MEIWDSVFKAAKGAAISIVDVAPVKATAAGALAFVFGNQGTALLAFIVLILIDLSTKWVSLSYTCLVDQGLCQERAGLWQCIKAMPTAFKKRYITSEMMKTKFTGKLILYMVLVVAAVHIDVMAGGNGVFLKASWYYLAATEAISIIENLRDAGAKAWIRYWHSSEINWEG